MSPSTFREIRRRAGLSQSQRAKRAKKAQADG